MMIRAALLSTTAGLVAMPFGEWPHEYEIIKVIVRHE